MRFNKNLYGCERHFIFRQRRWRRLFWGIPDLRWNRKIDMILRMRLYLRWNYDMYTSLFFDKKRKTVRNVKAFSKALLENLMA
jgi:hypothetical protein